jgi:hypothetical protein
MTQHTRNGVRAIGPVAHCRRAAIGPFRDWLNEHMQAHQLTPEDVARCIGRDQAMVRGWFGVRPRLAHPIPRPVRRPHHQHVGPALTGNPRLVPELSTHSRVSANAAAPPPIVGLGRDVDEQPYDLAA